MADTILPESIFTSSFWYLSGVTNILDQPVPADEIYSYAQMKLFIEIAEYEVSKSMSPLGYGFVNAQITASSPSSSEFSADSDERQLQLAVANIAMGKFQKIKNKDLAPIFFRQGNLIVHNLKQKVLHPISSGSSAVRESYDISNPIFTTGVSRTIKW